MIDACFTGKFGSTEICCCPLDKENLNQASRNDWICGWVAEKLSLSAERLSIIYPESGPTSSKPLLHGAGRDVSISIAHSKTHFAVAFSRTSDVGIDIEAIRSDLPLLDMAHAHFAPEEFTMLQAITIPEQQQHLFFRLWTCKEAALKLQGRGIKTGLAELNLTHLGDLLQTTPLESPLQFTVNSFAFGSVLLLNPAQVLTWATSI